MTNEEILQTFSDINHAYNNSTKYDTLKRMLDELTEPYINDMDDIIECIKYADSVQPKPRTDVLDKIRAEIEEETDRDNHADEYCDGYYDGMRNALAIIDKYKAESEPQERDET